MPHRNSSFEIAQRDVNRASSRQAQTRRVLIVDDEETNVRLLQRILARAGFTDVIATNDPRQAVPIYRECSPDLVLLDLHMPQVDGFAVLEELRDIIPSDTYLPILILTGDATSETRQMALRLGARDFLAKPFDAAEVVLRIENLLEARLLYLSLAGQNHALEEKVHERTQQLEAAVREAEAASHAKTQFLARMSHELRTPLNSVIGFANVLIKNKSGNLLAQDLAYLDRIQSNGRHLLGLINDVLDIAKVEAGKMEVEREAVALERVVFETLEQLEERFVGTKVLPRIVLPPKMQPVIGDSGRIKQVLINLVGNAIKFTAEGTVTVSVHIDAEQRPVRLDVADTGIGIPADRLSAIFESFEQAHSDTRRRYGGTGLGLPISRALCQLMGFELVVSSVVGRGATFSMIFREDAAVPEPAEFAWADEDDARGAGDVDGEARPAA
jgi:two-component system, sensor histidine kinase